MSVSTLLQTRYSVRAYLEKPVNEKILQTVFETAQKSPSNCNVQPWQSYVVSGAKKDALKQALLETITQGGKPNPDFNWLPQYQGIHKERQFGAADSLYQALNITRDDKQKRQQAMLRNWTFFDAPHVVFFTMDKYLDIMGAVDLGIYAQNVSLLLMEQGVSSCMQGALGQFPKPVRKLLNIPDQQGILFGMSFGYADPDAPVNHARTAREHTNNAVIFCCE